MTEPDPAREAPAGEPRPDDEPSAAETQPAAGGSEEGEPAQGEGARDSH